MRLSPSASGISQPPIAQNVGARSTFETGSRDDPSLVAEARRPEHVERDGRRVRIRLREEPVVAEHHAVVGREDEQRVVEAVGGRERRADAARDEVDRHRLLAALPQVERAGPRRSVRRT